MAEPGVKLGGAWWSLAGASLLAAPPPRRPLPGGGALGLLEGRLVPALDPAGLDEAARWVAVQGLLLAVEDFSAAAPADAPLLPAAFLAPPPLAAMPRLAAVPAMAAPRRAVTRLALAGLALRLGEVSLTVPAALVERIWPGAPATPVPAAPAGVLGYVLAGGRPALALDLGGCAGLAAAGLGELLAVLVVEGQRLALPCDRVATVAEPGEAFQAWLRTPAARQALALAPAATPPGIAPPEPQRGLLLCSAAGRRFAVPAEEVAAVIPPQRPLPPPTPMGNRVRGVCAHRGDILPVLDAGESMGGPAALASGAAPLLRLLGSPAVAIAVQQVHGLRQVAVAACTAVRDPAGLVAAIARFDGAPLPILRLAALSGATA